MDVVVLPIKEEKEVVKGEVNKSLEIAGGDTGTGM
jgi:hypothetical protein